MTKKNISVIAVVYNEAHRIDYFLKSFCWTDDLIIIDKSSTDNTRDIALTYTDKVFSLPYSDSGNEETRFAISKATNEWVMLATASDLIHPNLVRQLLDLINTAPFHYDAISIPYGMFVLGIRDPDHSPWRAENKTIVAKKSIIKFSNKVHQESIIETNNVYRMATSSTDVVYHLTHENLTTYLERHTRYNRLEAAVCLDEKTALKGSLREIYDAIKYVVWRQKSWKTGWDGVALGLAYISYFIFKYLFIWEKFRGKGETEYARIRKENRRLWENL